jgi:tetratricopeptide (TPR) repeat protein
MAAGALVVLLVWVSLPSTASPSERTPFKVIVDLAPERSDAKSATTIVNESTQILKRPEIGNAEIIVKALWSRGCAYLRMRESGNANGDFDALCKLRPKDPVFRALHALALADLGRIEHAEQEALEAVLMDPEVPAHHVVLGSIDIAQGKWRHAVAGAQSALHIDKEYPSALYLRGWAAFAEGDYEESVACLDKYLLGQAAKTLREPDHPYWIRGRAYLALCRHREALSSFSTARKLNALSAPAAEGICLTYIEMQKWQLAAKAGVELAALVPNEARIHQACAVLHARVGGKTETEAALRKARDLLPSEEQDADARSNLDAYAAMSYFHLGEYEKAAKLLDDAFKVGVIADLGWWVRCRMLASCPDAKYRDGRAALQIAAAMLDDEKQFQRIEAHQFAIYALLGDAQAECGDFASALASVRKAMDLAGDREVGELRERIELFENKKAYRHVVGSR